MIGGSGGMTTRRVEADQHYACRWTDKDPTKIKTYGIPTLTRTIRCNEASTE